MKADDIDPLLSRARDHLAMAIRLRNTASQLSTVPGKTRLAQLATLYEQLSLYFLEESRALSADRTHRNLQDDDSEEGEPSDPTSH